jgi:hypothetical protein
MATTEKKAPPALVKEVELTLRGKAVIAKFPNIGQMIQIEQSKQILTDGRYAIMAYAGLDIVDAISYLSSVVPDFYKLLGVGSHRDLLNMDMDSNIVVEMMSEYKEKYVPFFNELYTRTDRPNLEPTKE